MSGKAAANTQSNYAEAERSRFRARLATSSWPHLAPFAVAISVTGLVALIAAADFSLPAEINTPILYGICVIICAWTRSPKFVWLTAFVCAILTYAGLVLGPTPITGHVALRFACINRSFVAAKLLLLAVGVHLWIRQAARLRAAATVIEEKNDALRESLHKSQMLATVGQLTEGIAHDFRNVLTMIVGSLDMIILNAGDEARRQELARAALEAALSATGLVQRLLLFFRPRPLPSRAVHIGAMISRMQPQWQRALGEAIELIVHLPSDLWPCRLDPAQLEAALLDLAVNAKDAMAQGGRLTIKAENGTIAPGLIPELASGDYAVVSVSDNGPGIPPDTLAKVFDPFFTTKGPRKGSGLGLWMVRSFANQSGGTVRIDSIVGAGTAVRLYLPRALPSHFSASDRGAE